ncbi:hypothetical protein PHLGIDRAFT_175244 [Phlebiopsis gigantea 11061_1 CR5-6]|uniref:BTB domain-containing protein n=1 Tax=Phlebiopsis gigantea (strain 11061_1 CR5-6) TaxID=745531 RepID=A0A0C3S4D0_PHLG1|nr:hypothetical protein PHLGIDRAFT_175244 [Phlebiopsis gigantea 11061_1 CR5-6]
MADSITQIETSSQVGDGSISSQLVAPPPFNKPTADAVLRSCDGIDFYVVKAIMAEASSVFEDMFALPQPPSGPTATSGCGAGTSPLGGDPNLADDDGRIIRMTERSTIIEHVLRFVYPVDHPTIVHLEDVFDVLEMGTKFMIDCVVNGAKRRYETLAKQDPLKAYAIACKRQDHSGIHVAVKACLSRPIPTADNYIVELEHLSAGAYIRLQKYHRDCSLAIKALNVDALEYDHKEVPWIKSSIGYAFCWMTTVTPQGYRGIKQKVPAH